MIDYHKIKIAQEKYDLRASNSDSIKAAGQWGSEKLVPLICKEIEKKIKISSKSKILEIGCGSGVLGKWIKDFCSFYIGLDVSFNMLKKFFQGENSYLDVIQSTSHKIPLQKGFFDIIVMNSVTMYLPEELLKKTLNEILRVAMPHATIFIGDNITPSGLYYEYVWFQKLNPFFQIIVKPYIRFRKNLAKINPKLAGKWKNFYNEVSPGFIEEYFKNIGDVTISESATSSIKNMSEDRLIDSKRVDFVIHFR